MTTSVITPGCIGEVMNTKVDVKPEVGMGATMFVGSDCYAMVVTEVCSPKNVKVAHVPDEMLSKFVTDNNGVMRLPDDELKKIIDLGARKMQYCESYYVGHSYSLRKNGRWMPKGTGLWGTGSVRFGNAENYRDPSF